MIMEKMNNIPEGLYDTIIIGGGPAGLTAGIYAARGRMNALLIESLSVAGQATIADSIENFPGIEKTSGFELTAGIKKQAEKFGLLCRTGTVEGVSLRESDGIPVCRVTDESGTHETLSVIIASGARPRKLGVPGEEEFTGKGVSYCATCDAAFFCEKVIVAVGGGDTAIQEALFLTRFARKVILVHRRDRLRATRVLQERALANEKMEFVWDSAVEEICGGEKVEKVTLRNLKDDKRSDIPCAGVFLFVGWEPNTAFLNDVVGVDEKGYIRVDSEMKTSASGIFAAGDCCHKSLRQVVTAAGDGASAAFSAQQYVDDLKGVAYK